MRPDIWFVLFFQKSHDVIEGNEESREQYVIYTVSNSDGEEVLSESGFDVINSFMCI